MNGDAVAVLNAVFFEIEGSAFVVVPVFQQIAAGLLREGKLESRSMTTRNRRTMLNLVRHKKYNAFEGCAFEARKGFLPSEPMYAECWS